MADIIGITKIGGVATAATVTCLNYVTKVLVETKQSAVDGTYNFTGLTLDIEYLIIFNHTVGDIWQASTAVTAGDLIRSTVANGFVYKYTQGGTTGAIEPVWPTIFNVTIADNDAFLKSTEFVIRPTAHGPLLPF